MSPRAAAWFALSTAAALIAAPTAAAQKGLGPDEIEVVSAAKLTPRLTELQLSTPAVEGPTGVRVLLPEGYGESRRRYPVLYLLHGATDDYRGWTEDGQAEAISAPYPLIIVMPDSGATSGYVDWWNGGDYGPPAWETYHVRQLVPWIDRRYRTVAARRGRAVAGLSMGGGGAMAYAARHPQTFAHAAAFSGAVDTNHWTLATLGLPYGEATGPRLTQEVRARANNSWDLAENLGGLRLTLRAGNGLPGGEYGGTDPVEMATYEMSLALHRRLVALGYPHLWDDYGAGAHTWPYWRRDLRLELPRIMDTFADPPPRRRRFVFRAVEPDFGAWGWHVAMERPQLEFAQLEVKGARRFALEGSGDAVVTTAPRFRPGRYRAIVRTSVDDVDRLRLRAGRGGRLRVPVTLGPPNPFQQYTVEERLAGGSRVFRTSVSIKRR